MAHKLISLGASRAEVIGYFMTRAEELLTLAEAYDLQELGFFSDILRRTAQDELVGDQGSATK